MGCSSSKAVASPRSLNDDRPLSSMKEDHLRIAFKAKRGNVFTQSIAPEARRTFVAKTFPKTKQQEEIIRSAFQTNFAFESLLEDLDVPLTVIIDAMTTEYVNAGENIVTQGAAGDYFYVVERGLFTVLVDNKPVAQIGEGQKVRSFGELSLIYEVPRQATVRADTNGSLFALDRQTYRYTLANSYERKTHEIKDALHKVPLLTNLTSHQMETLVETVEVAMYNAGDEIIRKGAEGNVFYMIKQGSVKVTDVGEKFQIHELGPGDYFGERALMTNEPRAATVTATSKTVVMTLDKIGFQKQLGPLQDVLDRNLNMRVLSSITLFEKLTKTEKEKLCKSFVMEIHPAHTKIIKQGEQGSKFYILLDGIAHVLERDAVINVLKSGDYFGEMALLDDEIRKATITTHTECKCAHIDRSTFNKVLGSLKHVMERETMARLEVLGKASEATVSTTHHNSIDEDCTNKLNNNYQLNNLTHIAMLGSGTFGRVTLVQDKTSKMLFALKAMYKSEIVAHKQQNNVLNEKLVMMNSDHPFVLKLYQTFRDAKSLFMLLEFVQGGELFSVIHKPTRDGIPDYHAKFYGLGVLLALAHLHSRDIAYRDMKPENCLIDKYGYPKLVDFGFAKTITGKSYTLCGTPEYLSPELVLGRGHNKAVDYWAFGVLLYEMISGYSPFSDPTGNMDQVVICKNIVSGKLRFDRNFNADSQDLIRKLLTRDVKDRLGTLKDGSEDVKIHKWFSTIDIEKYTAIKLKAPWIPPLKSTTDTSLFEVNKEDEHVDNGAIDIGGGWDKDF